MHEENRALPPGNTCMPRTAMLIMDMIMEQASACTLQAKGSPKQDQATTALATHGLTACTRPSHAVMHLHWHARMSSTSLDLRSCEEVVGVYGG